MSPVRVRSRAAALVVAILAAFCSSCGGGGPTLHPVRGTVLFDGKPAEGATIVFQPAEAAGPDTPLPSGVVGPDGSFAVATHPHGAGAPAGDYLVLITWFPPDTREQGNPKNKLPARYSSADSSLKITVKPGENTLDPFKLTK